MKTTIEILEDQDGGLFLAVLEDGVPRHLFDGFEYLEAGIMLREILRALEGTEDWDGDSASPEADYHRLSRQAKTIAMAEGQSITIFPDRFHAAGRRFASREE